MPSDPAPLPTPLARTPRGAGSLPFPGAPWLRALGGLVLSSFVLLNAACSSGGRLATETPSASAEVIVKLDSAPRVDLPAKVSFFFQVTSEAGEPVAGLAGEDFRLFENGAPVSLFESKQRLLPKPQDFRSFSLLLLDRSASVVQSEGGTQRQIEAAQAYVDQVVTDANSFVAIYLFAGDPDLVELSGFENDPVLLRERIAQLQDASLSNLSTDLYGAVVRGTEILRDESLAVIAELPNQTVSLVTFTDGRQTIASEAATLEAATAAVESSGFNAFTIGLGDEVEPEALRALGPQGSVFAQDFDDLVETFEQVARKVRDFSNSFYFLSYCSAQRDGSVPSTHELRVEVGTAADVAAANYTFDSAGFGGGCGFIDVAWAGALGPEVRNVRVVELIERVPLAGGGTPANERWALVGNALFETEAGPRWRVFVLGLGADGAPDRTFGNGEPVWIVGSEALPHALAEAGAVRLSGSGTGQELVLVGALGATAALEESQLAAWRVELGADGAGLLATYTATALTGTSDRLFDVAFDAQGRAWAAGQTGAARPLGAEPGPGSRALVLRFAAAGPEGDMRAPGGGETELALDAAFGQAGVLLITSNALDPRDGLRALALDGEAGAVLVGGYGAAGDEDLRVFRVSADGVLDAGFGTGGFSANLGVFQNQQRARAVDVALDGEGRILVAGVAAPPEGSSDLVPSEQPAFWRLLPDGRADVTFVGSLNAPYPETGMVLLPLNFFAQSGKPSVDFGGGSSLASLVLAPDGGVLAVGRRRNAARNDDLLLLRLTERGTMETAYNGGGYLIDDGGAGDDGSESGARVAVRADGSLLIAGTSRDTAGVTRAVLWLDTDPERALEPR